MIQYYNNESKATSLPDFITFQEHIFEEQDNKLPNNSGLDWVWDVLDGNCLRNYSVYSYNSTNTDSVRLKLRINGLSETHHQVDIYINDQHIKSADIAYTLKKSIECVFAGHLLKDLNIMGIKLSGNNSSIGFDWFELDVSNITCS